LLRRKDSLIRFIIPNSIRIIQDSISSWYQSKKLNDSILSLYKQEQKDTGLWQKMFTSSKGAGHIAADTGFLSYYAAIANKYDTLISQLGLLLKQNNTKIDLSVKRKDTLYDSLVHILLIQKDTLQSMHIFFLTKVIRDSIVQLRKERYANRLYIAHYIGGIRDTLDAKAAVEKNQDSIKSLRNMITVIREYRKRTRIATIFPALSKKSARFFFGDVNDTATNKVDSSNFYLFQNLNLLYTNKDSTTNTTLRVGLFGVYAGPVRLEAATFIRLPKTSTSNNAKDTTANALSSLATGGGNLTLQMKFPLFSLKLNQSTFADISFSSVFDSKLSFDMNQGGSSGVFAEYGGSGIGNTLSMTLDKKVTVLGEFSFMVLDGNSLFRTNMGLVGDQRKKFSLGSYSIGLTFLKSFSIRYTGYCLTNSYLSARLNNMISFTTDL
jgi:hypothetical protein